MLLRISRPCYDKWWRCPGWAGGGLKSGKVERCDGGSLSRIHEWSRWCTWHCHRCPKCGLIVLPAKIRWVDPSWYLFLIRNPGMARIYTESWWILTTYSIRSKLKRKRDR